MREPALFRKRPLGGREKKLRVLMWVAKNKKPSNKKLL